MNDVHITIDTKVPDDQIDQFYTLYEDAFGPLRTQAVARQVLHRAEFRAEMIDARVQKHVARTADGEPIGVTTLTKHLDTVPWISPEYFAARYPEHAARDAIFYIGFTLVTPRARRGVAFHAMIESVAQVLIAERAVFGWDMCSYNNTRPWFTGHITSVLDELELEVAVEDTQTYYAAWFTGDGATKGG